MSKKEILIIDDDVDICMLLQRYLDSNGFIVDTAFSGSKGLSALKSKAYDVVLSDFRLPDYDGIDLIKGIKKMRRETQVIVITGYSDVRLAIESVKSGAFEYVTKPIQPEEILNTINQAIALSEEERDSSSPNAIGSTSPKKGKVKRKTDYEYVVGTSVNSQKLHNDISLIAPTDMSVIILGETGTGKEVAARTIHDRSTRAGQPFVAVDCGALPKELASSELFGHVKGSFTGAFSDKQGSFESANGGTLFLDEIGNLTYENQIKMLRVLQERKIKRVGDVKDRDIDVRILVATNEDLQDAVKKGEFREDLYYRLNEFKINISPLRERKGDLLDFADKFLQDSNEQLGKSVQGFQDDVIAKMREYYWHGNLRELKNVVKRATLLTKEGKVPLSALPQEIIYPTFISDRSEAEETVLTDLKSVAEQAEKKAIQEVLQKTGFNKTKTAQILKIDRKTLYNKISAYGIDF